MFITEAVTLTSLHLDIMPAVEQLLTLQARYSFLNLDRSVQIFHEGDRRCGTHLDGAVKTPYGYETVGMWEQ